MSKAINGRYEMHNEIGSGGMGSVYRVYDRLTGEIVAFKRVRLIEELKNTSVSPQATVEELRTALAREFKILASLRHPHIISVLDYGFDAEKKPFYTMDYIAGSQTILEKGELLDFEGKIDLIEQLLRGLAYLHRRDILHRDIKPENVLVDQQTVRMLDFGLSHMADEEGALGGSPDYVAPEILDGHDVTMSADLYAVGVLLYQLLAGHHPFGEVDLYFFERLLTHQPDWDPIDPRLQPLLQRLLAKRSAERPQSATGVLDQLAVALGRPSSIYESDAIRESYLQAASFVGRTHELSVLIAGLEAAKEDKGEVFLIGGESGVGKSRLLDELRTHALVNGWQVITGQEIEGDGTPYQLWRDVALRLALNVELNDLDAAVLQEIAPTLGKLLERSVPAPPALGGAEYEQRLSLTLTSLLRRQNRPILLILEDLHWSNLGLSPLKQMLMVLEQLPNTVLVGSYRDDERPSLREELAGAELLQLRRLNDREIAQLSGAILGQTAVHEEMLSLLTRETEGNTFFIVEVMRALAEDVAQLPDISNRELPTEVFTNGMAALLQRRIQKVDRRDLPLLKLAAVAGRQLDVKLMAHLMPDENINRWLNRISETTVISLRENQWIFSHDKLRHAVLEEIDPEQLISTHRQVATAIEQLYPEDPQQFSRLLAHWQAAGDEEKELIYLLPILNETIMVLGDMEKGEMLAQRGLELLPLDDLRRIELFNQLAEIGQRVAAFDKAEAAAKQALQLSQVHNDEEGQATSLNLLGVIYREQSRYRESQTCLEQALRIGSAADDVKNMAQSYLQLGVVAEFQKEYEISETNTQRSLSLYKVIGDQLGIAQCHFYLGMLAAQYRNDFVTSLAYSEQNLALFQAAGNQRYAAKTYTSMGIDYASVGDYAKARDYFNKSLTMKKSFGDPGGVGHTHMVLGECYYFEGADYAAALANAERAVEILLSVNAYAIIGIAYGYVACSHSQLGNDLQALDTALSHFELQETIELDKSNGLVHLAVAKVLAKMEAQNAPLPDLTDHVEQLSLLTNLPGSAAAYIQKAVAESTIAQIRMVVLIECGALALQLGLVDEGVGYLHEARGKAEAIDNRLKIEEIDQLLKSNAPSSL